MALATGQVLRSGRMVIKAITPKKRGDRLSGFPNAPLSPGQANFGASGQSSGLPSVSSARGLLQQMQAALARVGRNGLTTEELVEPSSLTFQDVTPVRLRRPEPAPPSDVDSQADATGMEQILKELHRIMQEVCAEVTAVKAEVQQVRTEVTSASQLVRAEVSAEMQQVRAEVQVWHAELEKTVHRVELNEAELRTQILGASAGLVRIEQKLQQEVAQRCAKLEMMQNEQEKKKGNEEERLNALVREHVEEFEQQREEKEVARLQEHQQSLEEWLKRSQREFNKKLAEKVDKLKQESETKVTIVGELHGHGATQPCIQAKSTRHPGGGVGRSPTIFYLFFSCKNHLIQVKDSQ